MVPIGSLWLPILLSAAIVFVASSIIHTVIGYHAGDFGKVPDEDALQESFRRLGITKGDYGVPKPDSRQGMKDPSYVEKVTKGPIVFMTVMPGGQWFMGSALVQWFLYSVAVSLTAAYVAGRALPVGADYLDVFRFAGTTAFACYAMALPQASIWFKKNWAATLRSMFDGLIYGALTAGVFGWLWPR
jgi:hypothetical protein